MVTATALVRSMIQGGIMPDIRGKPEFAHVVIEAAIAVFVVTRDFAVGAFNANTTLQFRDVLKIAPFVLEEGKYFSLNTHMGRNHPYAIPMQQALGDSDEAWSGFTGYTIGHLISVLAANSDQPTNIIQRAAQLGVDFSAEATNGMTPLHLLRKWADRQPRGATTEAIGAILAATTLAAVVITVN